MLILIGQLSLALSWCWVDAAGDDAIDGPLAGSEAVEPVLAFGEGWALRAQL
jgi:hypothetical protein